MKNLIINNIIRFRRMGIVQIGQKTLVSLFPFIILVAITRIIGDSVFSSTGYINMLLSISSWLPQFQTIGLFLTNFSSLLGGAVGLLLTAYFSAKYTAGYYGKSTGTAGITAFFFNLILYSRELFTAPLNDGALTRVNFPVATNLIFAIFIGYLVGKIFDWTTSESDEKIVDEQFNYQPKSIRPIFYSLVLAVFLNFLLALANYYNLFTIINQFFSSLVTSKSNLIATFINTIFLSLSAWFGNSASFANQQFTDDPFATSNLNYVLTNKTSVNIPYPYTQTTLYQGFGGFAGVGALLALVIAILLVAKNQRNKQVSLLSLFPALFNNGASMMVGVPIMLNVIYLIPFILTPLINMLFAYGALALKLMPPVVYPVPDGTPSVLYAFIGSGGSLRAFALGIFVFIIDVLIYIPFVKLNNRIQEDLQKEGEVDVQTD
ncbi:MAG: PTS sugar transporter subunit IIC [Streptococcus gordonii]|nr:PTS sugar transporter subunit IIC [Streptococcus gordonii]